MIKLYFFLMLISVNVMADCRLSYTENSRAGGAVIERAISLPECLNMAVQFQRYHGLSRLTVDHPELDKANIKIDLKIKNPKVTAELKEIL